MFLQLLVASHYPVYRNCFCEKRLLNNNIIINAYDKLTYLKTIIKSFSFMFLDIKKWRIVPTFVVYKNDDL